MSDQVLETNDAGKRRWMRMEVRELGELSEVIRGGGGKLTTVGDDPGESRKTSGMG